ncbi:MAG: hypothetical protein JXB42_06270 [Deltaproteobacteria bacterium]|nr:hypothetical protein [Deltaproteobacteria bacterium]
MKRRTFFKTGLLAILAVYGFPEKVLCFSGNTVSGGGRAGMGYYPFTGVYSVALAGDQLSMPDAFPQSLFQKSFILLVPERNSSVLLIPEASDEWKMLEIMFDGGKRDGLLYLRQCAEITGDGRLCLSERVRKFAGIRTSTVAVIGHGNVIEITDAKSLYSKKT